MILPNTSAVQSILDVLAPFTAAEQDLILAVVAANRTSFSPPDAQVLAFLTDRCVKAAGEVVPLSDLLHAWREWSGEKLSDSRRLFKELERLGFTTTPMRHPYQSARVRGISGLRLRIENIDGEEGAIG
jgi:hypothetical protein